MKIFWNEDWSSFANMCFIYWSSKKEKPTLYTFVPYTEVRLSEILESLAHILKERP